MRMQIRRHSREDDAAPVRPLPARLLACALIGAMLTGSVPDAFAHSRHTRQAVTASRMQPHERALQALNRLTFGPRPGDVERVEAMGVDKWIDQQLHPETIDDSAFEARLDSYPAMRLSQRDLLLNFPSEALIRAAADGKAPIPTDPIVRAIYTDRIAAYQEKQAEQKQAAASAANAPLPAAGAQPAPPTQSPSPSPHGNAFLGGSASAPQADTKDTVLDDSAKSPSIKAREQHLYADLAATGIVNLPPAERVARIVSMPPAEFEAFQKSLTGPEKRILGEGLTPQQQEILLALKNPSQLVGGELLASRFLRDVYSNRQLQAVMADFWLNHFNVYLHKGQYAPWYLVDFERNAILPHAMGKFEDLLVATAQSPAILTYLDNEQSIGPHSEAGLRNQNRQQNAALNGQPPKPKADSGLNENYARELMELHTLGVDGGYTQQDVTQVAEVFTGWGVDPPNAIAKNGMFGFDFNPRRHEPGPKTMLGQTIQPSGENEGLEVLHMLATSPATAHHISQQLAVRFVSDTPSAELVNSMAATWIQTGGDIREVLRTMFASPDFWSKETYRAKIKTPEEFVLSAVRATGGDVVRPAQDLQALDQLGMPFFGCQTPNGYSWTNNAWVNTGDLLDRMNIALNLANNRLGVATDMDALMASLSREPLSIAQQTTPQQKENWLADALLSGPASPQTQAAILKQINESANVSTPANNQNAALKPAVMEGQKHFRAELPDSNTPIPAPSDPEAATIAGLLLGSPDFQRR